MHRYTHWVFDLDGTLTVHQHDFEQIRAQLGIPPGRLILEYIETLEEASGAELRARLDEWEAALVRSAEAAVGAREVIELLCARQARFGILTRNTRANALATLAQIGLAEFFPETAVLGREDAPPKPAADGVRRLLETWQGGREQCVMVGDFRLDLEAGRNAGVATAHIAPTGADTWPELTDHRFESLAELAAALSEPRPGPASHS